MSGPAAPPDPIPHLAWIAARRAILEAHAGGRRVVPLLGAPGIGKTFLLADLQKHFAAAGYEVERIAQGDLLTGEESARILLVDEADRTEEEALQRLLARPRGFAVLAALPGFARRLEGMEPVRLGPLGAGEIGVYVEARLAALGQPKDRFMADAIPALEGASGGVPRLLNTLIGTSAFNADLEGEARVSPRHVEAAALLGAEIALPPAAVFSQPAAAPRPALAAAPPASPVSAGPAPRRRRLPWLGLGAFLLVLGLGLLTWQQRSMPSVAADAGSLSAGAAGSPSGGIAPEAVAVASEPVAATPAPPVQGAATQVPPGNSPSALGGTSPSALLPAAPAARVVLTYPRGAANAAERGAALAATLSGSGWQVGRPFPVSAAATAPALRYFFHEDREAALALAGLAGDEAGIPQLGNLAPGSALPRPGTIELALAANPPAPVAAQPGPARAPQSLPPAAPPPAIQPLEPVNNFAITASRLPAEVKLRWSVAGGAVAGCCYVEVVGLPEGPALRRQAEAFAGYAEQPESVTVSLGEPRRYAWRVIALSRDATRYAPSPWMTFTLLGAGE